MCGRIVHVTTGCTVGDSSPTLRRMRKLCWVAALVAAFVGCKKSQTPPPAKDAVAAVEPAPAPAPAEPRSYPQPFLWEVKHAKGSSWLLGTIHVGVDARTYVHPVAFEHAGGARVFLMEADLSAVDQAVVMELAAYPEGETIDQKLTAEEWEQLKKLVPLPEAGLKKFKPWFLVTTATAMMVPMTAAVDSVFADHAKTSGVKLAYLEDWQAQLAMAADGITLDDLKEMLADPEQAKQELLELIAAYKAGDIEATERLMFDPEKMKKSPKMYEVLLVGRNKSWIPMIEAELEQGNAFIAVGAGHLLGKDSVIDLLRAKGYEIERVSVSGVSADTGSAAPAQPAAK